MALSSWAPIAQVYNPQKAGSIDGTDVEPHDRAVIRALKSKYKPNKSVDGDPLKTIFVARLNKDTDEDTLWTAFRTFGKIKKCRLVRDIVTGFSKGYGFIEYEDEKNARTASKHGNKMIIENAEVFVDMECERTLPGWIPRRFGGGIGGNKTSGQLRFGGKDRPFIRPLLPASSGARDKAELGDSTKQEQGQEKDGYRVSRDDRSERSRNFYDRSRRRESDRTDRDGRKSSDDRRRGQDFRRRDEEYKSDRRDRRYRERSRSPDRDRNRDIDRQRRKRSPDYKQFTDTGSENVPSPKDIQNIDMGSKEIPCSNNRPGIDLEKDMKRVPDSTVRSGADMEEGECDEQW